MRSCVKKCIVLLLLSCTVLLSGCVATAVDQMYCLPKRSDEYNNLQQAIDGAMQGMLYSAPRSGENQQSVQLADLDGDGTAEAVLYARGTDEKPLKMLIFRKNQNKYQLTWTLESAGASFDQVEYIQMDNRPGLEIVVGRKVSDQVAGNLAVYSFGSGRSDLLLSSNYVRFLTCDLNRDGKGDLFVLRTGETEADLGITELYSFAAGMTEKTVEARLSMSAANLRRLLSGAIHGGVPAVFAASLVDEGTLVTDIYTMVDGSFKNISWSNEAGTSIQTIRNSYLYARDIDGDGIVELPGIVNTEGNTSANASAGHHVILWYTMNQQGNKIGKLYTFHNLLDGWYLQLNDTYARQCYVTRSTGAGDEKAYTLLVQDSDTGENDKIMTIFAFSGSDRDEKAVADSRFLLLKTENVTYAARLENHAVAYGITKDVITASFRLIQTDWKTGET